MTSWRPHLPGHLIRGQIAWLTGRVAAVEEAAAEEIWFAERNGPVLDALEAKVMAVALRDLARRGS